MTITQSYVAKCVNERVLYREYANMVYNLSYRRTRCREAAEDIRQQVFLKVFRSLDQFRQDCLLLTWIYRITLNECYDQSRRQGRERAKIQAYFDYTPFDSGRDEPKEWEAKRMASKVMALADPATHKALGLIHSQGLSHSQVAEVFGVSRVAISRRMDRFKAKVISRMGEG